MFKYLGFNECPGTLVYVHHFKIGYMFSYILNCYIKPCVLNKILKVFQGEIGGSTSENNNFCDCKDLYMFILDCSSIIAKRIYTVLR